MELACKLKTYMVLVGYKDSWPSRVAIKYHYGNLESASAHIAWLSEQVKGQNGEGAVRKNVVIDFSFEELLFSKKRNKKHPLLSQFTPPKNRGKPVGGILCILS